MESYRVTKDSPKWLFKAYDYVRTDAFVLGQSIPIEREFEGDDPDEELEAIVLVEDHKPIAGCRITYPQEGIGKIERVCVIREKQRTGVGHILIEDAEKWIAERGVSHIVISSQDRAAGFYERCGYHLVPGADPSVYEKHKRKPKADQEHKSVQKSLGFTCVLVDKILYKEKKTRPDERKELWERFLIWVRSGKIFRNYWNTCRLHWRLH